MDGELMMNAAMKSALSSHLSELRIEGTSFTAVDFSDPCSVCGNKKRRCIQPPTSFRKKVLIVEDEANVKSDNKSSCIDDQDAPGFDFPTTPGENKQKEEKQVGGCCSFCQRCSTTATDRSHEGLSRSPSLITDDKGGSFLVGVLSPVLKRTSSVVTEDDGGGHSHFLGRVNSITTNEDKRGGSIAGGSGSLLCLSRTSSVMTTEEKGGSSPFNARTINRLPVSPQLGRNGSIQSSISPLPPMSSGNLSSILSPEMIKKGTTGPASKLPSPVVVTKKKSKVHFSQEASPSAIAVTVVETKKDGADRTPNSGGKSAEKVKVSLKCQCGVRHKIIF